MKYKFVETYNKWNIYQYKYYNKYIGNTWNYLCIEDSRNYVKSGNIEVIHEWINNKNNIGKYQKIKRYENYK